LGRKADKELVLPIIMERATVALEREAMCACKILGVEILNEGSGISVDDVVSEGSATFVARAVEPMQAVQSKFTGALDSGTELFSGW
jgi:hypothetical protein